MMVWKLSLSMVIGYILGSASFSIILSKILGRDIRKAGSGNPGATNTARVFGMGMGLVTLAGDFIKTVLSIWIARELVGDVGVLSGGLSCLFGHCCSAFHHFKGGKGISCGAAMALMLDWRIFLCLAVLFLLVALVSRKVSPASILCAAALPVLAAVFHCGTVTVVGCAVGAVFVIFRHRSNIVRLIRGTEPDFKAGKPENKDK